MLDFFTIFSKGGIVLWCFQSTGQIFTTSVNALISNVILQERTGNKSYEHNSLLLKYKLDNEFELVFVVAYQKILQLSYVDKFLDDIQLEFRDKYKNDLGNPMDKKSFDFARNFQAVLKSCVEWGECREQLSKPMRTFEESDKSQKTVSSLIKRRGGDKVVEKESKKKKEEKSVVEENIGNEIISEDVLHQNRMKLAQKLGSPTSKKNKKSPKAVAPSSKDTSKKPRIWDSNESNASVLDYTKGGKSNGDGGDENEQRITSNKEIIGQMVGGIRDLEIDSEPPSGSESDEGEEILETAAERATKQTRSKYGGVLSLFKGLVGTKSITKEKISPVLEKLQEHLFRKNVASDIAEKLCQSVFQKLEGKSLGTFESLSSIVKNTMTESLMVILSPKRRVDILRDALEAKREGRPYIIAFCGVNGVGKSTNLAKICFWLIENNLQVLIAACDTFRAGAVEQLRTHMRHLNSLHPPAKHDGATMVQLYEKGYGKDASGIATEAINFAKESKINVVLIDTAGRMQDNEPLMKALTKLITVNEPDMVLFVGEALVGNEAVDQLVKFNQALADNSNSSNPHLIDGIVLTKFDTIDDKVGAAVSMTYITGQPIVFVGTGQTYTDLKSLNARAVVAALMK